MFMENSKEKALMKLGKIDVLGLIIPASTLIFWCWATSGGAIASYLLPTPLDLGKVGLDFALGNWHLTPYSGTFSEHALHSLLRVMHGFLLAASLGVPLGLLSGRLQIVKRIVEPSINLVRTVPGIAWLPVAMVWFGIGEKTTLFLISLAAFFSIYINAAQGAANVSPLLLRAGRMLGANSYTLFATVVLPASFPSLVAGLRIGLGTSWAYVVLGELTGVNKGLGAVMMDARMLGHIDVGMVTMIYIAVLGGLSDKVLLGSLHLLRLGMGVKTHEFKTSRRAGDRPSATEISQP